MNELQLTGGARIGMANATFPFATLKVSKDRLELNASKVGNLTFQSIVISGDFRRLIVKEGRELSDIKKFAIFAMIISGFMLLQMGLNDKNYELIYDNRPAGDSPCGMPLK